MKHSEQDQVVEGMERGKNFEDYINWDKVLQIVNGIHIHFSSIPGYRSESEFSPIYFYRFPRIRK